MPALELNAVVTQRVEVSRALLILRVAPDGWTLPAFAPGQFAVLGLPGCAPRCPGADAEEPAPDPGKLIRRSYSISSASLNRDSLEFYVTLVPSGALTPRLFALEIGDRLWLGPKITGLFTLAPVPADAHLAMIATGTGLAPYMSMLRSDLLAAGRRRVAVLLGARHSWDLGYRDELAMLARANPQFSFVPTVSRPAEEPVPWTGETGRVQDLWARGLLAGAWGFAPAPEHTHVLLCGNPDMIEDMVARLAAEGFREHTKREAGQVHLERYW